MNKKPLAFIVALGSVIALAGCQQPPRETVVRELPPPLVGIPYRQAPRVADAPVARPAPSKTRTAPVTADAGWTPRGGVKPRWKYIVIHHSGSAKSSPTGMDSWHKQRGWDGLGYHFVVGNAVGYPDGQVFVGDRWSLQKHGAHTKSKDYPDNRWNEHGIGICLIGNFESEKPTARQLDATARLVAFLAKACRIPMSQVYTHGGVDRWTKCPGHHFPLDAVKRRAMAMSPDFDPPVHASAN